MDTPQKSNIDTKNCHFFSGPLGPFPRKPPSFWGPPAVSFRFDQIQVDVWAMGVIMYGLASGRSTRSGVETHDVRDLGTHISTKRFGKSFPNSSEISGCWWISSEDHPLKGLFPNSSFHDSYLFRNWGVHGTPALFQPLQSPLLILSRGRFPFRDENDVRPGPSVWHTHGNSPFQKA